MRITLTLLALLTLALPAAAQEFRCPPAGQVVELSDGRILRQDGADPADPLVCLRRSQRRDAAPEAERLFLNALEEGGPATRAARRAAIASLLPFRPGAEARYTAIHADGSTQNVVFRVHEIAQKTLPAGSFTVVSLLQEASLPAGKVVAMHGLDAATGTYLSLWGEFQMGGMHTRAIPAEASRITPAAGQ